MDAQQSTGTAVWSSAAWRGSAVAWLDEQLAAAGIRRTGEVTQPHLRPWATLLTAPTTRGQVWLKAAGPATAYEVGLYELLRREAPDEVLEPIATAPQRGWMILPHGGTPLRDMLSGSELVDALVAVVPRYAEVQRRLEPAVDDLLALGVADMRAAVMPARFAEALEAARAYVQQRGDAADRATLDRLTGLRDTYAAWCETLAAAPGAPSLDHNDLHTRNILLPDDGDLDKARFYDWGDSVVAHPFTSMRLTLSVLITQLELAPGAPELHRVRDAYLDAFSDLAPHAELVTTLELACHVGKVARALIWVRALSEFGPDDADTFAGAPLQTLAALLDDSYLGGA